MPAEFRIDIDQKLLRHIVAEWIRERVGDVRIDVDKIQIEVKSKQNYKSEWESADFRAVYQWGWYK